MRGLVCFSLLTLAACEPAPPVDTPDARPIDSGTWPPDGRAQDRGPVDAVPSDAAPSDATVDASDAIADASDATPDAMPVRRDAALDATVDAMVDAAVDATAPMDTGADAGPRDMAPTPDRAPPLDGSADAADGFIPIWDAEVDAVVDAEVDLAVDAEIDAEPDMAPFDGPARSDDFEAAPLAGFWQVFNPQLFQREVRDGALWLTPQGFGLWFDRNTGPMVYQTVTGDFRVTARVRARRASAPDEPPPEVVHLGGLIARDPRTPPENYVFIVVGRDVDDLSVETKTTEGGRSDFAGPMWPHGSDAELRLCRIGADFQMYKRPIDGGEWALADTFARPDLPETLQVGAIAYTNSVEPDLTVGFEEVVFADVFEQADCLDDPID